MGGLTNPPAQIQKRKRKKPAEHITGPASPSAIGVGVRTPAARTGAAAGSSLTAKASPEPLLGLACVPSRPRPGCRPPDPSPRRRSTWPARRPGLVLAADCQIRARAATPPRPRAVPASAAPPTAGSRPCRCLALTCARGGRNRRGGKPRRRPASWGQGKRAKGRGGGGGSGGGRMRLR